jgi:hypothetical protein
MISQRFPERVPSTFESLVAQGEFEAFGETISHGKLGSERSMRVTTLLVNHN